jgi:hypothetical protein
MDDRRRQLYTGRSVGLHISICPWTDDHDVLALVSAAAKPILIDLPRIAQ